MKLKKVVAIAAAAGALAAISVPAMAFENEFHGMYRAYGIFTNALSGTANFQVSKNTGTDKYIEQRARLQYIAKASDDLKLVTHFEADYKFGGAVTSSKYVVTDGGGLDADRLNLETKSIYLDFKIPAVPVRAQVGMQPFNDAFNGLYGNFDATGAVLMGNFGALKATYGYFTVGRDAVNSVNFDAFKNGSNQGSQDLNVLDLKFAVSKDLTIGTSYYMLLDKVNTQAGTPTVVNNTVGLNADGKFGPVQVAGQVGFQFGKTNNNANTNALATTGGQANLTDKGTTAMAAAVNAKIAVGPGKINLAALYLTGDKDGANNYNHAWQSIGAGVNYYTPANMWLLTRNVATINTSTAIGASSDITRGGRGILGFFGGYEGTAGKVFYNGNVGYAKVDRVAASTGAAASIGTELNATVGYKLYDNMSAAFTGAYAILGDGYSRDTTAVLPGGTAAGKGKADNPFMAAIALNYAF